MMTIFAYILLALPVALALYAYVLYPGILWWWARRMGRPVSDRAAQPLVTIVVPAYNEQAQIRGSIESLLAQSYPANRRQILIISDASSDDTDAIVCSFAPQGVELLRMPKRVGKTAAENTSLPHIRGEIVVNCDASVRLHPDAVRLLVAAMADSEVGVASTRDVSITARHAATGTASGESSNAAEAGYVGYEMGIRDLETRTGGIVGASGSGYAIRAELHRKPVRADLSRDFSAALTARRHRLRAVSVPDALCYVPRTASLSREYRRKVRTISRGMDTLLFNRDLMDPIHHGTFAWKLVSHKLVRWLVPLSAFLALGGALMLAVSHPWSRWLVAFGLAVGALALVGANWPDSRRPPRFLPVGVLGALSANLAVVHAAWRVVHGHQDHTWEPTRRTELTDAR